jgi:Tol biopolymer transport system component
VIAISIGLLVAGAGGVVIGAGQSPTAGSEMETAAGPASPLCAHGDPPPAVSEASHPDDGVPDRAGRIVFGRLTRVDDTLGQLVSLYAIDPDGSDLALLLDCEVARPRFSPDGSTLAFAIAMDDGSSQIATLAADGSDLRILTSTAGYADTPDWAPDGSWLVYSHSPTACVSEDFDVCALEEGMHQSLWRMDADGSKQALLGDPTSFDWEPRLSPDGHEVVFTRIDPPNAYWFTLMIRDLETGAERVVTSNEREPEHPEWSPDGSSIIYNTLHAADPSVSLEQIELVPADDATAVPTVLYKPPSGGLGAAKPTYSPDGSRITFGCSRALCTMNADGSDVLRLASLPDAELNHFAWGRVE